MVAQYSLCYPFCLAIGRKGTDRIIGNRRGIVSLPWGIFVVRQQLLKQKSLHSPGTMLPMFGCCRSSSSWSFPFAPAFTNPIWIFYIFVFYMYFFEFLFVFVVGVRLPAILFGCIPFRSYRVSPRIGNILANIKILFIVLCLHPKKK